VREEILDRGVFQLQIGGEVHPERPPYEYQVCKLKTVGWYLGGLIAPDGQAQAKAPGELL